MNGLLLHPRGAELPADVENPDWKERAGRSVGHLLAPLVAWVSKTRRARMFHPEGVTYRGRVEVTGATPDLWSVGRRLSGAALVRLSSAWWRGGKEWLDALGVAVRFLGEEQTLGVEPPRESQDLLFATIRFPWTTPLAPLATNVTSFLWNHFHAVSPFEVEGVGKVKLRLRSPRLVNGEGVTREEHLARAVADGKAVYELEVRRLDRPVIDREWEMVARLTLEGPIEVDQAALRFSPFRAGGGIRPVGFVHYLRLGAYAASQAARP